jgi:hypothetical protein
MNLSDLINTGPSLTTFIMISLPGTVVFMLLIWLGKYLWTWFMGRKKLGGYLDKRRYFHGDRRENPTFHDSWSMDSPNKPQATFRNVVINDLRDSVQ